MATLGNFIGNVGFYNTNGELAIELPCYELIRTSVDETWVVASDDNPLGHIGAPIADLLPQLDAAGCNADRHSDASLDNVAVTPKDFSNTVSIALFRRDSNTIQYLLFDSGTKLGSLYSSTNKANQSSLLIGKDILTDTYHLMSMYIESYSSTNLRIGATNAGGFDYPVTRVTFTSSVNPDTAENLVITNYGWYYPTTENWATNNDVTETEGNYSPQLRLIASVSDGGTLTAQWYKNGAVFDIADTNDDVSAVETTYQDKNLGVGIDKYYCILTNTLSSGKSTSITLDTLTVTVTENTGGDSGNGDGNDSGGDTGGGTGGGTGDGTGDGSSDMIATADDLKAAFWSGFASGVALYGRRG